MSLRQENMRAGERVLGRTASSQEGPSLDAFEGVKQKAQERELHVVEPSLHTQFLSVLLFQVAPDWYVPPFPLSDNISVT